MRWSKEDPFAELWLKYPRAAISEECWRAAAESRVEMRSAARPCCLRSALICARTPCSSEESWLVGRSAVAPAGEATTQRPNATIASATRRTVRLPMPGESAAPSHVPHPSNELPAFSNGVAPAVPQPIQEDDVDGSGDGNRGECAEHARELGADQDRDEDREGRQLDRASVDDGLQQVVLDLLVDDEENDHDDSGRNGMQEGDRADDDRRDRRTGERDQVEDADHEPERDRKRNAHDGEHDRGQGAGDQADQEVACDIAADRAIDVVPDRAPAPSGRRLEQREE